jgi:phosphatidylethanolamine/phosphatidyl-N-methylethanolamine N-methyltransferase
VSKPRAHSRKFLSTFFKERKQVGAVAPSSRFLVKKMCDKINFKTANVIVELGPGTGVFTTEILKRANAEAKIFVIELNDNFYELLKTKIQDPRIILLNQSADQLDVILKAHGVTHVDAILSSLPLAVIPDQTKKKILVKSYEALKCGGVYVQYQYSLASKRLIKMCFPKMKISFTTINLPPAFIYTGTK